MPGIVGIITRLPRQWAEPQLQIMVESLRHEVSYATGTWADERLGVYVGWTERASEFSGRLPLRNENGEAVLVFSGEDFPEPGTIERLKRRGHDVEAEGPSYLVHLAEEAPDFPAGLNGTFHGLLMSRRSDATTLFNDRYGMHRIYYHESKEAFYFAAEAKAILALRPQLRSLNPQSLGEFIACGCALENRTLFEGINLLPPAAAWVFRNGGIEMRNSYFSPREWEEQAPLGREAYYRELRGVFARNLPRYFKGREGIGMSLTGGLDSRMIMAWQKPPRGSLPCYSFGGMFRDCQDVLIAKKVALACGQSYEVISVANDFLSKFSHYASRTVYLTEGCIEVGHSPDLYVNERAVKIAPVRMTGNYGGEVMRRVRAFKPVESTSWLFNQEVVNQVRTASGTYDGLVQGNALSFAVFRQAPWHHFGLRSLEETQLALRSPYLDNDFVRTVFRAPDSATTNSDVSLRLINDGDPALGRIRTDRGLTASQFPLAAAARRGFLEFTFKTEYAYDYGMPQWVAQIDHLLSPLCLERLFLGRHKFNHFRIWYRDVLSKYVQETLLDPRALARPYLAPNALQKVVSGHLKGDRNYTTEIHKALTLELLHRHFLDPH